MTPILPPLLSLSDIHIDNPSNDFYITRYGTFSRADLFAHAYSLSEQLPPKANAINLCQNRYLFVVAYLAAMFRNQISLIPPNQSPRVLNDLLASYNSTYCLTDNPETASQLPSLLIDHSRLSLGAKTFPIIDQDRTVSISFTSGSTGKPKAIPKNWREFQTAAILALKQLNLLNDKMTLVSTVPPQHMYGLETSLFWPLYSSICVQDTRPFFPEDIRASLCNDTPTLLVSTPTHLKACTTSTTDWPPINMVLSSTAPMPSELACKIERQFKAPLYELLGSTETLSYASRQPVKNDHWQPYHGVQVHAIVDKFAVQGGHLRELVYLDDLFAIAQDGTFTLSGRATDLIKIAGKRASLVELNKQLNAIPGVEDGIFFCDKHERLSIVIVSNLSQTNIRKALKESIDPVFLPRRIIRTTKLPRNNTGKLLKTELEALIGNLALV